jgi:dihydrofolate reductase
MARLIYSVLASLDGYIEDDQGQFGWAKPDEEVHALMNDLERPVGTHLYGRGLYEVMSYGQKAELLADPHAVIRDFAEIWQAADKVVFSKTLEAVSTPRTRIEREFDADAVRKMKAAAQRDMTIGGAGLAAQAIRAGLVDEYHLVLAPVVVGGGKRALPGDVHLKLELVDTRRFDSGFVHLHYRAKP